MTWDNYWNERSELHYYKIVKEYIEELGDLESILDVGCGGCPVVTWGNFKSRTALNLEHFKTIPNVECVVYDWNKYTCENKSLITCLQVIEHLESYDIRNFTDKIFNKSEYSIISVPYKWPKGACSYHRQDPIDVSKFIRMLGKDPIKMEISNCGRIVGLFK